LVLGFWVWGFGARPHTPNPKTPIPNPQSPINNSKKYYLKLKN